MGGRAFPDGPSGGEPVTVGGAFGACRVGGGGSDPRGGVLYRVPGMRGGNVCGEPKSSSGSVEDDEVDDDTTDVDGS